MRFLVYLLRSSAYLKPSGLHKLDISQNRISKHGTVNLCDFLQATRSLEVLKCMNCDLHIKSAIKAMQSNLLLHQRTLKSLNLSGNKLKPEAGLLLSALIEHTQCLKDIVLKECKFGKDTFQMILEGVFSNKENLKFSLDLSQNALESLGKTIPIALRACRITECKNISVLILNNCKLGMEGVNSACSALCALTSLRVLMMDGNIKHAGIFGYGKVAEVIGDTLCAMLMHLSSLRVFSFAKNEASTQLNHAITAMCKRLGSNTSISSLDISQNGLHEDAFTALSETLATNTTLKYINVDQNKASVKSLECLLTAIAKNGKVLGAVPFVDIANLSNRKTADLMRWKMHKAFKENRKLAPEREESLGSLIRFSVENRIEEVVEESEEVSFDGDSIIAEKDEEESNSLKKTVKMPGTIDIDDSLVFGVPISDVETVPVPGYVSEIPKVLVLLKDSFLENGGLHTVGVFRVSSGVEDCKKIKKCLETDTFDPTLNFNIHSLGSIFKLWLRSTPHPLLQSVEIADVEKAETQTEVEKVLSKVNEPFISILYWVFDFMVHIEHFEEVNMMSLENLSIVMAPNLYSTDDLEPLEALSMSKILIKFLERAVTYWKEAHPYEPKHTE